MQPALLKLLRQLSSLQTQASVSCWDVASAAWLREALAQLASPSLGPAHGTWAAMGPV